MSYEKEIKSALGADKVRATVVVSDEDIGKEMLELATNHDPQAACESVFARICSQNIGGIENSNVMNLVKNGNIVHVGYDVNENMVEFTNFSFVFGEAGYTVVGINVTPHGIGIVSHDDSVNTWDGPFTPMSVIENACRVYNACPYMKTKKVQFANILAEKMSKVFKPEDCDGGKNNGEEVK